MAKGRFGSGGGNTTSSKKGRLFSGSPRKATQQSTPTISEEERQRETVKSEITKTTNELNQIQAELARLNPADGPRVGSRSRIVSLQTRIQSLGAKLNYLRGVEKSIGDGRIISNFSQVLNQAETIEQRTFREKLSRKQDIRSKVKEDKIIAQSSGGYGIDSQGNFYFKGKRISDQKIQEGRAASLDAGIEAQTAKINEDYYKEQNQIESEQNRLYSGTGLSREEAINRDILVKSGFIKEKSTATGIQVAPVGGVYTKGGHAKTDLTKPQYFDTSSIKKYIKPEPMKLKEVFKSTVDFDTSKGVITPQTIRQFTTNLGGYTLNIGRYTSEKLQQIPLPSGSKVERAQRFLNTKVPFITRGQASQFIGDIYTLQAFSPLIKTATTTQQSVYSDDVIEVTYKGEKVKVLKSEFERATSRQALLSDLKFYPRDEQIRLLKISFTKDATGATKLYLDKQSFLKDVYKASRFLGEAGLKPSEANIVLKGVFPKLFETIPKTELINAQVTQQVARQVPKTTQKVIQSVQNVQLENIGPVQASVYAGQGLYERTDMQIPALKLSQATIQDQKLIVSTQTNQRNQLSTSQGLKLNLNLRSNQLTTPTIIQSTNTLQLPKVSQSFKTIQTSATQTRPQTKLRTDFLRPTRGKSPTPELNFPRTETPRRPIPPSFPFTRTPRTKKSSSQSFTVFGRRQGIFRPIGRTRSQKQALSIGASFARTTLGATFKVQGLKSPGVTPKGFYSKTTPGGLLFIEQPKFRLSTVTEVTSIQKARRKKRKRKV